MRRFALALVAIAAISALDMGATEAPARAADARKTPYFASIAPTRARMRTGPGRNYPASWLYVRAGLPVKVVAVMKEWRKIEDPDGTEGWMLGTMVSATRTAIVSAAEPIELRERPSPGARLMWRAERGVVGRVSDCSAGWCRFDVKGQAGYAEISGLWGIDAAETLP